MKNNFIFFLGLVAALGLSWAGIVLGSNAQLGTLAPYYDDNDQTSYPQTMAGIAARGQLVYKGLGCIACHTQQVRRPGFGSDKERGWGDRQSVARDYIYQPFPQLGNVRLGPDLANLGDRKPTAPDADDLLHTLYAGADGMPSYRFLFEHRRLGPEAQPSEKALKFTGKLAPKPGWEIVPTRRAEALVAYLVNLKSTYSYPESVPVPPAKAEGGEAKAAPATPAPTAAPGAAPVAPGTTPAPAVNGTAAPAPAPGATPVPAPPGTAAPKNPTPSPSGPPAPGATPAPAPGAGQAPAAPAPTPAPGTPPAPASATPAPSTTPTPVVTPAPAAGGTK